MRCSHARQRTNESRSRRFGRAATPRCLERFSPDEAELSEHSREFVWLIAKIEERLSLSGRAIVAVDIDKFYSPTSKADEIACRLGTMKPRGIRVIVRQHDRRRDVAA